MKCSTRNKIAFVLPIAVAILGLVVMFGWLFHIDVLTRIHPSFVTMKVPTALMFIIVGFMNAFLLKFRGGEISDRDYIMLSIFPPFLIAVLVLGSFTPLADFLIHEKDPIKSIAPNQPSIGTLFAFLITVFPATLMFLNDKRVPRVTSFVGAAVMAIAGVALLGYILNIPALYYFIPGISTGMAIHTAVAFLVLGLGLINSYKDCQDSYAKSND